MTSRPRVTLWIALLLIAAACGGAEDTGSLTPTTARGPDWGSGMTYSDCIDQGLTDHGLRTGQKWIGDFYADLYHCTAPTTTPTDSTPQPSATSTTTLAPLRGLRYEQVFADVRTILGEENAMPLQIVGRLGGQYNYLITREGRVWIVEEGAFSKPPVLDLRDSIAIGSETGLLGIALHPTDPHRMFLYYTDLKFDIILGEYQLDDTLRRAIPSSAKTLIKIPTRSDFHKGGMIAFGPDGYLYIGVGDDGYSFNGQEHTTLLGSILRIDVDGGAPYGIPTDQPPFNTEAPEVYLYGIRNPWRFWIDPITNLIFIGDVGSDAFEEIDITSLDTPGANFGWSVLEGHQWGPFVEGTACQENPGTCDTSGFTPPALALPHSPDVCAVIGGVVYGGKPFPSLRGITSTPMRVEASCAASVGTERWRCTFKTGRNRWVPWSGYSPLAWIPRERCTC